MAITKITKPTEIEQWHLAKDNILYKKKKNHVPNQNEQWRTKNNLCKFLENEIQLKI